MRFVAARVAYADSFGWAFARRMASRTACATQTRYGHVPLFWRCPDCAHSVQKFGQSFWMVRCESDPQSTTYGLYDAIVVTMQFSLRFTQRPCLDLRFRALIVPFGIHHAFAFRAPVLRACEAASNFDDLSCRMLCIVVWDIVPRYGHVPGNVRTLRR
jgi:hypothetical protein